MKISLAWLFDHLQTNQTEIDVKYLVDQFNLKVAEIEHFEQVSFDPAQFTVARVVKIDLESELYSPSLKQNLMIAQRADLVVDGYYLLKKLEFGWTWASGLDFNSANDSLMPALDFSDDQKAGAWVDQVELQDYLLHIDNKSLTHRPDLWGHRGLAREIGFLLGLDLKPQTDFLAPLVVERFAHKFAGNTKEPVSLAIETPNCKSLAGIFVPNLANRPAQLKIAIRLFRLDQRSINWFVDATNYVMLDFGQPMHVFDYDKIKNQTILARQANQGEALVLLGEHKISLNHDDIVIADGQGPVSLAGIKGGLATACTMQTTNLFLESACFDATVIRKSAAHHKIRTESSARYEKTLDPNQNVLALQRFIKLQQQYHDQATNLSNPIIAIGTQVQAQTLTFSHDFIEKRLGITIPTDFVVNTLTKLGFSVATQALVPAIIYQVTVPTWRASKDINLPIDLVEEIARLWGYDQIKPVLPAKLTLPGDLTPVLRLRKIKDLLVSFGMHEVENYPFYDESFLQAIDWQANQTVQVINPVSENWRSLVTSLIPHLCKNVQQEAREYQQLRYFEWGRTWELKDAQNAVEKQVLAGIFYDRMVVDFYVIKNYLTNLFKALNITVIWQKSPDVLPVWYHPYQTAILLHAGKQIGIAGKLGKGWLDQIAEGEAFGFEIDGDFLLSHVSDPIHYKALSKFPAVFLDISLFAPLALTVDALQTQIQQVDQRIYQVELIDSFKKDDWLDKKALTFRYFFVDYEKTLSGAEIAVIQQQVEAVIQKNGASVR